jgi:hypothetical protein
MTSSNLRALEALVVKCRQDEERAADALAAALKVLADAEAAKAVAEHTVAKTGALLDRAIAETRVVTGAVQRMTEARQFAARRRDEHAVSEARLHDAEGACARAREAVSVAQRTLAERRGTREAVEGRIAAEKKAIARKAEERVEEEAADRAGRKG